VFNNEQMNQTVFAFRRYGDASCRYTGIERHDTLAAREGCCPTAAKRSDVPRLVGLSGFAKSASAQAGWRSRRRWRSRWSTLRRFWTCALTRFAM
jgi:hypothetical protein